MTVQNQAKVTIAPIADAIINDAIVTHVTMKTSNLSTENLVAANDSKGAPRLRILERRNLRWARRAAR